MTGPKASAENISNASDTAIVASESHGGCGTESGPQERRCSATPKACTHVPTDGEHLNLSSGGIEEVCAEGDRCVQAKRGFLHAPRFNHRLRGSDRSCLRPTQDGG